MSKLATTTTINAVMPWATVELHGVVLRVPPEQFYWTYIPHRSDSAKRSRDSWRFALEAEIPLPIESIESRVARLDADRKSPMLACAVEPDRLQQWIDQAQELGDVVSVCPSDVPVCLSDQLALADCDHQQALSALDFCTGTFESPLCRSRRHRMLMLALTTLVFVTAAWCVASLVSAQRHRVEASQAAERARLTIESVLGPAQGAARAIDPRMRLLSELRVLRQARDPRSLAAKSDDRTATFIALLSHWPSDPQSVVRSLSLEQDTLSLRGDVREPQDYEALSGAIRDFEPNWGDPSGQVSRARQGYSFTVAMRRQPTGAISSPSAVNEQERQP